MKEVTDLYGKMLIGTFSFIGPSFTLLIGFFYRAIEKSRIRHHAQIKNMNELLATEASEKGIKELRKLLNKNEKELNLLRPKRQLLRWAACLGLSITFLEFYYFQHSHFWKVDSMLIKILSVALSITFFIFCIFILWQLFCTIIKCKLEDERSLLDRSENTSFTLKADSTKKH